MRIFRPFWKNRICLLAWSWCLGWKTPVLLRGVSHNTVVIFHLPFVKWCPELLAGRGACPERCGFHKGAVKGEDWGSTHAIQCSCRLVSLWQHVWWISNLHGKTAHPFRRDGETLYLCQVEGEMSKDQRREMLMDPMLHIKSAFKLVSLRLLSAFMSLALSCVFWCSLLS